MLFTRLLKPARSLDASERAELDALRESNAVMTALLAAATRLAAGVSSDDVVLRICESVVGATPRVRLAWFWVGSPDATELRPMISAGPAKAYAGKLVITKNAITRFGPAFRALLSNHAEVTRVFALAPYAPWRDTARQYGLEVAIALPLRMPDPSRRGLLVFYADDRDYFERVGLAPFEAFARFSEVALAQSAARFALATEAQTDALTGLPNRRALADQLDLEFRQSSDASRALSVLVIDVDHFKSINDSFGHDNGDRVLKAIARAIGRTLRRGDSVGRWGGEEFVVVLPQSPATEGAAIAERIRGRVERLQPALDDGRRAKVTVSIGVASLPAPTDSAAELLRDADRALLAAKRAGRNRVVGAAFQEVKTRPGPLTIS